MKKVKRKLNSTQDVVEVEVRVPFLDPGLVGWVGVLLEKVKINLNSTQVAVEVDVRVELGKNIWS